MTGNHYDDDTVMSLVEEKNSSKFISLCRDEKRQESKFTKSLCDVDKLFEVMFKERRRTKVPLLRPLVFKLLYCLFAAHVVIR